MVHLVEEDVSVRSLDPSRVPEPSTSRSSYACRDLQSASEGMAVERGILEQRGLSDCVITTLLAGRKKVTSQIYLRTWKAFGRFMQNPIDVLKTPDIPKIFDFLQAGLDKQLRPSTLKVQVSALSALFDYKLAEHPWIKRFLSATVRMSPVVRPLVPPWDLNIVLNSLTKTPFEPLVEVPLKILTFKPVFLLAVTSARRVGEITSFSMNQPYLSVFNDRVVLSPDPAFLPKRVSDFHRTQVVILPSFCENSKNDKEKEFHCLDVRRCLLHYLEISKDWRLSPKLLLQFQGPNEASCPRLLEQAISDSCSSVLVVSRMKLGENAKFLDYQESESQLQSGTYRKNGVLRSRSSLILSQEPSRSIFHSRSAPTAEEVEVRFHVGDQEEEDETRNVLFTQLNELFTIHEDVIWKETARWIKFEEKTEDGGERWSKPHVTTLTLHSLFELRTCFERGIILLDAENSTFKEIVEQILKQRISSDRTTEEENENILHTLLQGHVHHIKKSYKKMVKDVITLSYKGKKSSPKNTLLELPEKPSREQLKNKFRKKIPNEAEAANILVGEVDFLTQPFAAFIRMKEAAVLGTLTEVALPTRFIFILLGPRRKLKAYHEIGRAIATLLTDELFRRIAYKAINRDELIAGIDDFLDEVAVLPPGKWDPTVRIQPPKFVPSVQRRQAVLQRESKSPCNGKHHDTEKLPHGHSHVSEELLKTTKLFGGLIRDVKRKTPWYWSDFYDALNLQCFASILFIYLATATNAITFGGMLGDSTDNMQGVLENFVGTAICGGFFCLFSGQPLTILSSTGPVLVFERLLYNYSKDYNLEYLEFRLWIGLWVAFYCIILVATNAAYLVQYFTRFTEESFCALISCIFIYDAVKTMLKLADHFPVNWSYNTNNITQYNCICSIPEMVNESASNLTLYDSYYGNIQDPINLTQGQCTTLGGHLVGSSCNYVPDVFLMSVILFLGTFICTSSLKSFQTSRYLSTSIRKMVGDFSVIVTIVIFCAIDVMCGLETPKLVVPNEFKPTNPNRGWFVYPFGGNQWWVCLLSGIPAILITILLFMDQQITAVILNRKEYKLKKGAGLHLDFFCISLLIIVTSFMGLPWYVSATVISLAHMNSLKMETTVSAPGEQPKFLGIREQRVTGLIVFILTGVSVFLSPVLKYIPMPVLYGIFLQMGVAALKSIQFTERLKLLLVPPKHQPDLIYLRHVPLPKVHFFTLIQLSCLVILWILKSTVAAIIFPLMLLALAGIRKAMECIFSLHDLSWLDDILPGKVVTDEEAEAEEPDSTDSEDSELKYQEKAPEINISVN
ncbi:anion exchange protein 4 [Hyla sarda]|uniref:anion exchange protein 4 n=1 Tax=Hyla sarda TaxID=327740 RepID=UPI0024C2AC7A|nr:anion exchange protein 4 [Hyla sarda]